MFVLLCEGKIRGDQRSSGCPKYSKPDPVSGGITCLRIILRRTGNRDRLIRIVKAAGKPNVGLTVDVGNFLCVNEDPVVSVAKAIKYADMIHLKDFYIRKTDRMFPQKRFRPSTPEECHTMLPSLAYVGTNAADYQLLRGAIIGQGDMDMWKIISIIKNSGYDQEISLEFEGMEDCIAGTYYGLETAKQTRPVIIHRPRLSYKMI